MNKFGCRFLIQKFRAEKMYDDESICDRTRNVIADYLGHDYNNVTISSDIFDLGADSLDVVELIMALEEEFCIEITDEDAESLYESAFSRNKDLVTVGSIAALVAKLLTTSEQAPAALQNAAALPIPKQIAPIIAHEHELHHVKFRQNKIADAILQNFLTTEKYAKLFNYLNLSSKLLHSIIRTYVGQSRMKHITTAQLENVDSELRVFILTTANVHYFLLKKNSVSHSMSRCEDIPLETFYKLSADGKIEEIEASFSIGGEAMDFSFSGVDGIDGAMAFMRKFMSYRGA